ncbi:MAG: hypothetical protein R6W93_14875 [Candidatus Limnocylindrales bacterium]
MDDVTARTRTLGRRMASAKPAVAARRSSSLKRPTGGQEPQVSPARWAGVALVLTAILAASVLAVLSPSQPEESNAQPGTVAGAASPTPAPSVADMRVPTGKPTIVSPGSGPTPEYEIAITVDVPEEEELPRKLLSLVVLRGDEELAVRAPKFKLGGRVTIKGVPLLERSDNELAVALKSEAGIGPPSDSVVVTQDPDAPALTITAPSDRTEVSTRTVTVKGTSEVGAEVTIKNESNGVGPISLTVGSSGEFEKAVQLQVGINRIAVESKDQTAVSPRKVVRVTRVDSRPYFKVDVTPKRISKPGPIKVVVTVTDAEGEPMADATVAYTLRSPTSPSDTHTDVTGANGRSVWKTDVAWSSALADAIQLGVSVTSPGGDTVEQPYQIEIS